MLGQGVQLGSAYGKIVIDGAGALGTIKQVQGDLKGLQGGFAGLQSAVTVAGGVMAGAVGLAGGAVAGIGVAGIKAFGDFESQMNEVFTLLPGISQEAMGQMSDQVLQFSQDMGVLPEEVVPALYQALSAGVPADNVFEFLETSQKAALGGVTELETSVDGISSVVNAYGSDLVNAAQASDVMFTAVRLGKTNFEELSNSLYNVLPTAASLGVGFEDVSASLAVLTAQGVPTSVATTQIRQALNEAADSGSDLGMAITELTGQSFTDLIAGGANSTEIFEQLRQSMPESDFRELFSSVEAMNGVLGLTGPNADAVQSALTEMGAATGATDQAFETMDQGINRTMDRLWAFKDTALIEVGNALSPLIDRVIDFAEGALPKVQEILETAVIPAIELVADRIAAFFNNLEEGMSPLDSFIEAIWDIAPQWLLDALVGLRDDVLPGLMSFFSENIQPILDYVGQFVSWKDVLMAVGVVVTSIVIPALYSIVSAAAPVIAVGAALVAGISLARNAWENDWLGIRTTISQAWEETIKPTLFTLWEWLNTNIPIAIEWLRGKFEEYWPMISGAISTAWDTISGIFDSLMTWLNAEGPSAIEPFVTFFREQFQTVVDWVDENWPLIQETIATVMEAIRAVVEPIITWLVEFWQQHGDIIMENAALMWDSIKAIISNAINNVLDILKIVMQVITGDWEGAWETIKGMVDRNWETIKQVFGNAIQIIKNNITVWLTEAQELFGSIWQSIADGVGEKIEAVKTSITDKIEEIKTFLSELPGKFLNYGRDALQGFIDGAAQMGQALIDSVLGPINDAIQGARGLLQERSPSKVFADIGKNVSLGLAEGVKGAASVPQAEVAAMIGQTIPTNAQLPAAGSGQGGRTLQVNGPLVSITVPEGSGAEDVAARSRSSVLATLRACGYA